ncbi:unnamed protein product [Amoebophrya sp. A120]|nr:unnamed protein product [Amoebophrya sp. A120]|eukprot:GSA120T00004398001.1
MKNEAGSCLNACGDSLLLHPAGRTTARTVELVLDDLDLEENINSGSVSDDSQEPLARDEDGPFHQRSPFGIERSHGMRRRCCGNSQARVISLGGCLVFAALATTFLGMSADVTAIMKNLNSPDSAGPSGDTFATTSGADLLPADEGISQSTDTWAGSVARSSTTLMHYQRNDLRYDHHSGEGRAAGSTRMKDSASSADHVSPTPVHLRDPAVGLKDDEDPIDASIMPGLSLGNSFARRATTSADVERSASSLSTTSRGPTAGSTRTPVGHGIARTTPFAPHGERVAMSLPVLSPVEMDRSVVEVTTGSRNSIEDPDVFQSFWEDAIPQSEIFGFFFEIAQGIVIEEKKGPGGLFKNEASRETLRLTSANGTIFVNGIPPESVKQIARDEEESARQRAQEAKPEGADVVIWRPYRDFLESVPWPEDHERTFSNYEWAEVIEPLWRRTSSYRFGSCNFLKDMTETNQRNVISHSIAKKSSRPSGTSSRANFSSPPRDKLRGSAGSRRESRSEKDDGHDAASLALQNLSSKASANLRESRTTAAEVSDMEGDHDYAAETGKQVAGPTAATESPALICHKVVDRLLGKLLAHDSHASAVKRNASSPVDPSSTKLRQQLLHDDSPVISTSSDDPKHHLNKRFFFPPPDFLLAFIAQDFGYEAPTYRNRNDPLQQASWYHRWLNDEIDVVEEVLTKKDGTLTSKWLYPLLSDGMSLDPTENEFRSRGVHRLKQDMGEFTVEKKLGKMTPLFALTQYEKNEIESFRALFERKEKNVAWEVNLQDQLFQNKLQEDIVVEARRAYRGLTEYLAHNALLRDSRLVQKYFQNWLEQNNRQERYFSRAEDERT